MRFSPIIATGTTSRRPFCPAFSKAGEKFPEGNAQKAALPPENACKASGIHALCVQVGAAPRHPGKCREAANDCCESNKDIRRRRQKSREAAHCIEVCKTSMLHSTHSVLLRQGTFLRSFCFCKKNQKAVGVSPCDPGSNRRSIHYFGLKFRFSSCNRLCVNHYFAQY